jgi:hypothetical protein
MFLSRFLCRSHYYSAICHWFGLDALRRRDHKISDGGGDLLRITATNFMTFGSDTSNIGENNKYNVQDSLLL